MGPFQMISNNAVSNTNVQLLELYAAKVGYTQAQSAILASLMTVYPPVFAGPKEGQSMEHHFGALKTFEDYTKKNS